MTHYHVLGVPHTATSAQIREAYRAQARLWHPDRSQTGSSDRMALLNEAYRVLSDPGRRAIYDRELSGPQVRYSGSAAGHAGGEDHSDHSDHSDRNRAAYGANDEIQVPVTPARVPWRFMLFMATIGIGFVLINAAFISPAPERPIDGIARPGSCVQIEPNGDARVVRCSGSGDLVVQMLIPASQVCPLDTMAHRDYQGLGTVCVTRSAP
jgi:molecular chaperone DnaJ